MFYKRLTIASLCLLAAGCATNTASIPDKTEDNTLKVDVSALEQIGTERQIRNTHDLEYTIHDRPNMLGGAAINQGGFNHSITLAQEYQPRHSAMKAKYIRELSDDHRYAKASLNTQGVDEQEATLMTDDEIPEESVLSFDDMKTLKAADDSVQLEAPDETLEAEEEKPEASLDASNEMSSAPSQGDQAAEEWSDRILLAYQRFCDAGVGMTDEDWEIVRLNEFEKGIPDSITNCITPK